MEDTVCTRPKCFKTKKEGKCRLPNPYIIYMQQNGAQLKRAYAEIAKQYKVWKKDKFRGHLTASAADKKHRNDKMCDMIAQRKSTPRGGSAKPTQRRAQTQPSRPSRGDTRRTPRSVSKSQRSVSKSTSTTRAAARAAVATAEARAAVKVQSLLLQRRARAKRVRARAAAKINAIARGILARKRAADARLKRASDDRKKRKAAVKINARARGMFARKHAVEERHLQARKRAAKERLKLTSDDRKKRKEVEAAAKINARARGIFARKRAAKERLQLASDERKKAKAVEAAVKINARARGMIARKHAVEERHLRAKKRNAARTIQRVYNPLINIHKKATSFYGTCVINNDHIDKVRKTFHNLPKPDARAFSSLCDFMTNFYGLPIGCVINRLIAANTVYFVYSGLFRGNPVYIKVSSVGSGDEEEGALEFTAIAEFDYVRSIYTHARATLGGGIEIPHTMHYQRSTRVGVDIGKAIEGSSLQSQMRVSVPLHFRKKLMSKLGALFGELHQKGCHGDAHFENILVKQNGDLALIDIDRMILFGRSELTQSKIRMCRLYDMIQIMTSMMFPRFSKYEQPELYAPTIEDYNESPVYKSFVTSYFSRMKKGVPPQQVDELRGSMEKLFRANFVDKNLTHIHKKIDEMFVRGFWPILAAAIRKESRKAKSKSKSRSSDRPEVKESNTHRGNPRVTRATVRQTKRRTRSGV